MQSQQAWTKIAAGSLEVPFLPQVNGKRVTGASQIAQPSVFWKTSHCHWDPMRPMLPSHALLLPLSSKGLIPSLAGARSNVLNIAFAPWVKLFQIKWVGTQIDPILWSSSWENLHFPCPNDGTFRCPVISNFAGKTRRAVCYSRRPSG